MKGVCKNSSARQTAKSKLLGGDDNLCFKNRESVSRASKLKRRNKLYIFNYIIKYITIKVSYYIATNMTVIKVALIVNKAFKAN